MAVVTTPKIPTTPDPKSPYTYLGNIAPTGIATTISASKPQTPVKIAAPPSSGTGAARVASQTTGYPMTSIGGGPTQDPFGTQTPQTIPWSPSGGDPTGGSQAPPGMNIDPQTAILNYLNQDAIRSSQIAALNAGLASSWGSSVLPQAQALELQFGGVPIDPTGALMTASQFGSAPVGLPTTMTRDPVTGAYTGTPAALSLSTDAAGNPVPLQSLGAALLDPTTVANAQGNRNSALASIARQLAGATAAARARYSGGGIAQMIAERQSQANEATQQAANTFLGALNDLYSGWLGNFNTATGSYGQYNQDAFSRMMQLVQQGVIDPFGTRPPAPGSTPPGSAPSNPAPWQGDVPSGWNPPDYGPDQGYTPAGQLVAPDVIASAPVYSGGASPGVYRAGGGTVTYQSKTGNRKVLQ